MEKPKGVSKETGAIKFLKQMDVIYGENHPEVVMVMDDNGTVRREILRNVRASNDHVIIADLKPNWIQGLSKINIEPLKRKEGLTELENFRNKMLGSF